MIQFRMTLENTIIYSDVHSPYFYWARTYIILYRNCQWVKRQINNYDSSSFHNIFKLIISSGWKNSMNYNIIEISWVKKFKNSKMRNKMTLNGRLVVLHTIRLVYTCRYILLFNVIRLPIRGHLFNLNKIRDWSGLRKENIFNTRSSRISMSSTDINN